jgi:hypothetical protein
VRRRACTSGYRAILSHRPLPQAVSHALHLVAEAVLGLLGLLALGACVLGWRLAQGPIDVTALVQREHALFVAQGAHLTIGHAALAWEGFSASGRPIDLVVQDVAASTDDGRFRVGVRQAKVALSVRQLLAGRIAPRTIVVTGANIELQRTPDGSLPIGGGQASRPAKPGTPPWLTELTRIDVRDSGLILRGPRPGTDVLAPHLEIEAKRHADGGLSGTAHSELVAGAIRCTLDLRATPGPGGTAVSASLGPVSPADLAELAPVWPALHALSAPDVPVLDAPVELTLQAHVGPSLQPLDGRLLLAAKAGTLRAGRGTVGLASLAATLSLRPAELRLEAFKAELAALPGPHLAPPVITGTATATRQSGRVHATFGVQIDAVALADLAAYWPAGTGGDSRAWLVENLTAGRAHDAQVSGSLDAAQDGSDLQLTGLIGGLEADDATVVWLRPIPGLEHVRAHVGLEGPDALRVTMDRGGQNGLSLAPGSSIRITGLSARHQFGDIDAGLSGALPAALGLLNHPRLKLLSRGGLEVAGAKGDVTARLTMRIPLEARVTMDDITIGATATLARVHLDRIAAGRDLDDGELKLLVSADGLQAGGTGAVAGIPAQLGLAMDFRNGEADQVLQHVTASGTASVAQLQDAGLPSGAVHVLTGGDVGLRVDYAARRDGAAALQIDADLTHAAVMTPLGWSKPIGQAAAISGRVTLDHGRLLGVDALHAEGPGLVLASRARLGQERTLLLDRLDVGRTSAHGQVSFPSTAAAPIRLVLAGKMLDLSPALDPAPAKTPPADDADEGPEKPGQPWAAKLDFDQVQLSHGKVLSPLHVNAASDGLRLLHAEARAGSAGELVASVVPDRNGRAVSIAAEDAGVALRALGVADNLAGGQLQLDGRFDDTKSGSPLSGTATLTNFSLRTAPAIGRLLQAMTLYGLTDALRGPGLHFSRLVAPFRWEARVLHLENARAFSPSLGITAQGALDLRHHTADITGTVVPAYFFNQLLGDLPLIGKIFSPEKGGGVFAARYSVRGKLSDPKVGVNPLSALTPGFLREGFGLLAPRK